MKIIFKKDGSIYYSQLDEYINQNSTGVNTIFVTIMGRDVETYTCSANFKLPNGLTNKTSGVYTQDTIDGKTYNGYKITLTSAQTAYNGNLKVSIELYDNTQNRLWSYPVSLVVNPTMQEPSSTITNEEYNALLSSLAQYQLAFIDHNMRSYTTFEQAVADIDKLTEDQIIAIQAENGLWGLYKKENGTFVDLTISGLSTTEFLRKAEAKLDVSTNGIGLKGIPTSYDKTRIYLDNSGNIRLIPNSGAGVVVGDTSTIFSAIYKDSLGAIDNTVGRSAYYKNDRISYSTGADSWHDLLLTDIINKQTLDTTKEELQEQIDDKLDKKSNIGNQFHAVYGVLWNTSNQTMFNAINTAFKNTIAIRNSEAGLLAKIPLTENNEIDWVSLNSEPTYTLNYDFYKKAGVLSENLFGTSYPGQSEDWLYVGSGSGYKRYGLIADEPGNDANTVPGYNASGELFGNTTSTDPKVLANKQYVDNAISNVLNGAFQIVDVLPATGKAGVIYAVPMEDNPSAYELYVWEDNSYKSLGKTEIDLSNYYNKTEVDDKLRAKLTIPTTNPGAKRPTYLPVLNFSTGDVYTTSFVNVDSTTNGNTIVMRDNNGDVLVKDNPTTEQGAINQKHLTDTLGGYLVKTGDDTGKDVVVGFRHNSVRQTNFPLSPNSVESGTIPQRKENGQILGGQSPDDAIEDNELLNYKYVSTHYVPIKWDGNYSPNIPYLMETLKQEDGTFVTIGRRLSSWQDQWSVPCRDQYGNLAVFLNPTEDNHATSKKYVDTQIANVENKINKINYGYLARFYGASVYSHQETTHINPKKHIVFTIKKSDNIKADNLAVFGSYLGSQYNNHYRRKVNFNKEPYLNVKALKKRFIAYRDFNFDETTGLDTIDIKTFLQFLFNSSSYIDWDNVNFDTMTQHKDGEFALTPYNGNTYLLQNYDRKIQPTRYMFQSGGGIILPITNGGTIDKLKLDILECIPVNTWRSFTARPISSGDAVFNVALHFATNDETIYLDNVAKQLEVHRNNILITIGCHLLLMVASGTQEAPTEVLCEYKFNRLDK